MLKSIALASAVALCAALPARAAGPMVDGVSKAPAQTSLAAEVVQVETTKRNPAGVILTDALGGAVAGAAVGGGVVLYDHYVTNSGNGGWGNWGRTIAIGAGIGLAAGLIFGVVDAASSADRVPVGPLADQKDLGFAAPQAMYGARF